ncbi:alpha/beta hydrolase [Mycobacterium intermedium]|uniref:Alpha/beta hydrolase n=1 Tax=Mycobacterium intermedium TaxID=28445 RepID=A0A1E3SL45_MYCIE|nr:alpha/beta hydrolase [Mycobacterium intermedium]ODR02841.1 alpha/beta hydrolase [Mycobacterium intermedium]OPE49931.1 alpha/beta hydrolase [Mycobacterium intermedium]ORB02782.1 alpha/beta hydrolase [Mycobacterium intermedium]
MSDEDARKRQKAWLAGSAGLTAVATIVGASARRSLAERSSVVEDPWADEDFDRLDSDRAKVVTTPDGVELAVREAGPEDAPLTIVFAHGFCLHMGAFHFQRTRLSEHYGSRVRMVFYDQRGHGQSGQGEPESYTLTQLGQDLETVLQATAPRGLVVLVGHSMGGMTVLSHARQFPERYGKRIVGAALLSSAAEGVTRSPLGEFLKNPALNAVRFTAKSAPKLMDRGRNVSRSLIGPILRAASYSDLKVSRSLDAFSQRMMTGTPIATLVGFLRALETHDETGGLWTLLKVPTLVVCGDHDLLTPDEYSRLMAASLPQSELIIVEGASHLALLDKPDPINEGLIRLVERAVPNKMTLRYRRFGERLRERFRRHG